MSSESLRPSDCELRFAPVISTAPTSLSADALRCADELLREPALCASRDAIVHCGVSGSDTLRALHGDLLVALRTAVPGSMAVCYAGFDIASQQLSGSAWLDGMSTTVPSCCAHRLASLSECNADQHAIANWALDAIRPAVEAGVGMSRLASVRFEKAGRFLGVGVVVSPSASTHCDALRVHLARIAPTLSSLVASYERCTELERQFAVRCAMPRSAVICAVNLDSGSVVWSYGVDLGTHPARIELECALVGIAQRLEHGSTSQVEPVHLDGLGTFVEARELHTLWRQRGQRMFALGFEPDTALGGDHAERLRRLSKRERQIALLLASGYAAVNIAAILQLSEHTIRTYIRRLYRKLGVSNRADFARQFLLYTTEAPADPRRPEKLAD